METFFSDNDANRHPAPLGAYNHWGVYFPKGEIVERYLAENANKREALRRANMFWATLHPCRFYVLFYIYLILIFSYDLFMRSPCEYSILEYFESGIILSCLYLIWNQVRPCLAIFFQTDEFFKKKKEVKRLASKQAEWNVSLPSKLVYNEHVVQFSGRKGKGFQSQPMSEQFKKLYYSIDGANYCFDSEDQLENFVNSLEMKAAKERQHQSNLKYVQKNFLGFKAQQDERKPLFYQKSCAYPINENINADESTKREVSLMKAWLVHFILEPLKDIMKRLDAELQAVHTHHNLENISINTLKQFASDSDFSQDYLPTLAVIMKYIDMGSMRDLSYIVKRIRALPDEFLSRPFAEYYMEEAPSSDWQPDDDFIAFHLFCVFMDLEMGASLETKKRPFYSRYIILGNEVISETHLKKLLKSPLIIHCSGPENSMFSVRVNHTWIQYPKNDGLYRALNDFFRYTSLYMNKRLGCYDAFHIIHWLFGSSYSANMFLRPK